MAEFLGGFSAILGILTFASEASKCAKSIYQIRDFNKHQAKDKLEHLGEQIRVLQQVLPASPPADASAVDHELRSLCVNIYQRIEKIHTGLTEKLNSWLSSKSVAKSVRLAMCSDLRTDIVDAEKQMDKLYQILNTAVLQQHTKTLQENTTMLQKMEQQITQDIQALVCSHQEIHRQSDHHSISTPQNVTTAKARHVREARKILQRARVDCSTRQCFCSCHKVENRTERLWGVQYTPLDILLKNCDVPMCTARDRRLSVRFCLYYWIPVRVGFTIQMHSTASAFSIRPALEIQQHVVPYTSPGFEALVRCAEGLITPTEACRQLQELKRRDRFMPKHVDPSGMDYVQFLIRCPWHLFADRQFEILEFMATELDFEFQKYDQQFLTSCAWWIGESHHLDLLNSLIEYGLDTGNIHSPQFDQWPEPCSPDWICQAGTPDPFFLEYMERLSKAIQGFAGCTPLQRAMYHEGPEIINMWLERTKSLEDDRNFLGQTPLHVSIYKDGMFHRLLDAGHAVDVTDNWGITPLMYAAAMGKTRLAKELIQRGADLSIRCKTSCPRYFDSFAAGCHQWSTLIEVLEAMREYFVGQKDQCWVEHWVERALIYAMTERSCYAKYEKAAVCIRLFKLATNLNFSFEWGGTRNNNLLHYAESVEEIQGLIDYGFNGFHQQNSRGHVPLASLAMVPNAPVFDLCLSNTNITNQSIGRHHILFELFSALGSSRWLMWDAMDSVRTYLRTTFVTFDTDRCSCPCAPNGCSAASLFDLSFKESIFSALIHPIWALEWISQVEDVAGQEAAKQGLLLLIRRMAAEKLGVTHQCCHRGCGIIVRDRSFDDSFKEGLKMVSILAEGEEKEAKGLAQKLEEEMLQHADRTFEALLEMWLGWLKDNYDARIHNDQVENSRSSRKNGSDKFNDFSVDRKNDRFIYKTCICDVDCGYTKIHINSLASYTLWLEHDLIRRRSSSKNDPAPGRDYHQRFTRFLRFINGTATRLEDVVQGMESTTYNETRSEKINKANLISHFIDTARGLGRDVAHMPVADVLSWP